MIIDVLECSSLMSYYDTVPQMGRVTCVARVGSPPFVEGLCLPVAQARFIWRDANAVETLQQMRKALRISSGVLSDVSPGGYGCA
jgi:hypothetical protein